MVESYQPPSYAHISLILGEQRSGKSTTSTALPIDDYHLKMDKLISPNGEFVKAKCIDKNDKQELRRCGIVPNIFNYVRVFSDDEKQSKIIKKPKDWLVGSPIRIFSNYHLFGVKYVYITIVDIIQYMNSDLFVNSWVLSDESAMVDTRNNMTTEGKQVAQFLATIGKQNIHFVQNAQLNGMVEVRLRAFATTHIICSYDERTCLITCDIKERGKNPYSYSYDGRIYRRFFDTTERQKVSEKKLAKALANVS